MPYWMKWTISILIGLGIVFIGFKLPWGNAWILKPFFVLNCLVLIIVVLLQSGKAADLAGAFGGAGSQTAFGPRGAATVLSQATTWCAIMFMVCALALVLRVDIGVESGGSVLEKYSKPATKSAPAPVTPAPGTSQPVVPQSTAPAQQPSAPQQAPAAPAPQPKQ